MELYELVFVCFVICLIVSFLKCLCGSNDRYVEVIPEHSIVCESSNQRIIGRGTFYHQGRIQSFLIIKWTCHYLPKYQDLFIGCKNKEDAYQRAKCLSLGAEPIHNYAHGIGQKNHYHLSHHCYIKFGSDPKTLVRIHFSYGPFKEIHFNNLSTIPRGIISKVEPIYHVIDSGPPRGHPYIIVKWPYQDLPTAVNEYIDCTSKDVARKEARTWSRGRNPLHHYAHEPGQKDHFHLFDHFYIIYNDTPNVLVNLHFRYDPVITKKDFDTRYAKYSMKKLS